MTTRPTHGQSAKEATPRLALTGTARATLEGDEFLTASHTAAILKRSPRTLANWRSAGRGPAYVKVGGAVRYGRADLANFIAAHRVATLDAR
jgi:hypothetical protein